MNQGCLRGVAYALVLLGALLGLLGLIFLLAPGRAGTGLIMLVLATALLLFAGSRLRALARLTPAYLESQLTALAAAADGRLTLATACGHLRLPPTQVAPILQDLASRGLARVEYEGGAETYVFPGLVPTRMVKKCPYCGNEYPVKAAGRTCPSCGGNLAVEPDH